MKCQRCGSTQFDEENGLYYCSFCQTQSQGFTQEIADKFVDKTYTKEIRESRKPRRKTELKTGVLWTTTEAFNCILYKQMIKILEIDGTDIEEESFKSLVSLIWFSYLRSSDIAFIDNETDQDYSPRLHPASRFRDQQILKGRVNDFLPKYKNGSKLGFVYNSRLGSNRVIKRIKESDQMNHFDYIKSIVETNYDLNDVYYDKYDDPRIHVKQKESQLNISKESRKKLRQLLAEIDLQTSFDNTMDLLDVCDNYSETEIDYYNRDSDKPVIGETEAKPNTDDILKGRKQAKSEDSNSDTMEQIHDRSDDWFENDESYDEYDKELMRSLTETTKLFSKFIPLSYMKKSHNIATDYFVDLMSLPKTLAILNIVIRLLNYNIYGFDLIRWSCEGHIPYLNCLTCFPDDWHIMCNDFPTFTSDCIPSSNNINKLTAKIAKHIGISSFPKPNLRSLLKRFVKDLNLPKGLIKIIENDFNLFEHFPYKLDRASKNLRLMKCLPFYERWTLMAIVVVLKRIFVLDDTTERRLSESARNVQNLFIWDEWEKYTRLRFELIKSYYIPIYGRYLEDFRDIDVIREHALKRGEYENEKTTITDRKALFRELDFRIDVQRDFQIYIENECDLSSTSLPSTSLYPLTNATDFALSRIDSPLIASQLSVNFSNKLISPWVCSHGNTFHRGYKGLEIGNALRYKDTNWSSSFKLLVELSSVILHCHYHDLFVIINQMEKVYFGNTKAKSFKR